MRLSSIFSFRFTVTGARRAVDCFVVSTAIAGFTLAVVGCGKASSSANAEESKGTLIVAAWEGYFPPSVRDRFEEETGYSIEFAYLPSDSQLVDYFAEDSWTEAPDSDPEIDPKLLRKPHLLMPAAFTAEALANRGFIQKFDQSYFPDELLPLKNGTLYNPEFDLQNEVVIPYAWGATGIAYDAERVDGIPTNWSALFSLEGHEPAPKESWGFRDVDRIALLDDSRFTLGSVLLHQKKSPNTTNPADVYEAADLLVHLDRLSQTIDPKKKFYKVEYAELDMPELLREGKIGLSMSWSADVTAAMHELQKPIPNSTQMRKIPGNSRIRIALPEEGSILFRDSFVIPKGLNEKTSAAVHKLIEFMLNPRVAAEVTNSSFYATTVEAADAYVDRFILNGPSYFIHPAGENSFLDELGPEMRSVYQEAWANVRGGRLTAERDGSDPAPEIISGDF